jgi:hypothetical protein
MAIGSQYNAWVAFRATSEPTFTLTAPEGTSLDFYQGWVSVYAQHLPVGSLPVTFLVQSLLSYSPYYRQMSFSVKPSPGMAIQGGAKEMWRLVFCE